MVRIKINYLSNNNYLQFQDSGNAATKITVRERVNRKLSANFTATTNVLFNLIKRGRFQSKALFPPFLISRLWKTPKQPGGLRHSALQGWKGKKRNNWQAGEQRKGYDEKRSLFIR